jgi:hypothetical protein
MKAKVEENYSIKRMAEKASVGVAVCALDA